MTLIHCMRETPMDVLGKQQNREDGGKSSRPVRNRRYTRRSLVAGQRPQKRLFTPEIKRYLKDWLVRRRENPYPNREEKKTLAHDTGLTYIQICNWFANWRRKLKNVNVDRNQQTWGHLIRTYNDRAQGNVEQFSICSEDSIWSEPELASLNGSMDTIESRYADSSDTNEYQMEDCITSSLSNGKYEHFNNNIDENIREETKSLTSPLLLSKWLESAARFQPSVTNYSCWADGKRRKMEKPDGKIQKLPLKTMRHDRDEVEAAVALTTLAGAASRLTTP
ncbi:unnamed protein product [Diatraea saccharalis]|uniref:Homeobox domain-containing protein n=1 Tax=Diatraea saccharalis TaxID=40085 RepID=A0A9N9W8U2_9NEOP|nr:unnamed protein product [Diatraea saccharalis]